jgi:nitrogen PTS system EIIA component
VILRDLIKPECVACNVQVRSKKHCLEVLSELLAGAEQATPSERVFANLIERERLGNTCLARGIAFPHCRVSGIQGVHVAVIKLAAPVEFDASDGEMIDLVFGMMVPEVVDAGHHKIIEQVAGLLCNREWCARLRAAPDSDELYRQLLSAPQEDGREPRAAQHG